MVGIQNFLMITRLSGSHSTGPESMRVTHQRASIWRWIFAKLDSVGDFTMTLFIFRMVTPSRSSSSSLVEGGVEGKVISCKFSDFKPLSFFPVLEFFSSFQVPPQVSSRSPRPLVVIVITKHYASDSR